MIPAFLAPFLGPILRGLSQTGVQLIIAAALAFGALFCGWKAADIFATIIVERVQAAIELTNTKWQLEIADANLKVALAQAAQASEAMRLNSELAAAQQDARQAQEDLRNANAALPGGDAGGLDAQRVQLLNRR